MAVYLVTFASVIALSLIINNWKLHSVGFIFFSCCIVTALALVAGLRASIIGTDTESYALPLFELAHLRESFQDFYNASWYRNWHFEDVSNFEIGYLAIVWLAGRVGSFQFQLFLTSVLTVGPFYYTFARKKDEISLPLCLTFFVFTYFNTTLNGMRQWIAMAFVFMALCGEFEIDKPLYSQKRVIILLILSMTFHTSALMGALILLIAMFYRRSGSSLRYFCIVIFAVVLFVFALDVLRHLLGAIGLDKYLNYLGSGNITLAPRGLIMQVPFLILSIFLYKEEGVDIRIRLWLMTLMTISVLFSQVSSLSLYSARIGLYFDIFEIYVLGMLYSIYKKKGFRKIMDWRSIPVVSPSILVGTFSIGYSIFYWCFYYAFENAGETIPYLPFW